MTLVEVVVSIVLVAVLTAITVPAVRGRMRDASADAVVAELTSLQTGVMAYRSDVGRYPPSLSYLTAMPTSGQTDWCFTGFPPVGRSLPAGLAAKYQGPYISRVIDQGASYYAFADNDTVDTKLYDAALTSGPVTIPVAQIVMWGVDTATARLVDLKIDGSDDPSSGRLKWHYYNIQAQLQYSFAIRSSDDCP